MLLSSKSMWSQQRLDVMSKSIHVPEHGVDVLLGTAVPVDAMCDQGVGFPTLTLNDVGEVVSCCHLHQQSLTIRLSSDLQRWGKSREPATVAFA